MSYTIRVGFDEESHRYFVIHADIPGLNIETDTFEEFVKVAQDVAPDLLQPIREDLTIRFEREIILAA